MKENDYILKILNDHTFQEVNYIVEIKHIQLVTGEVKNVRNFIANDLSDFVDKNNIKIQEDKIDIIEMATVSIQKCFGVKFKARRKSKDELELEMQETFIDRMLEESKPKKKFNFEEECFSRGIDLNDYKH